MRQYYFRSVDGAFIFKWFTRLSPDDISRGWLKQDFSFRRNETTFKLCSIVEFPDNVT